MQKRLDRSITGVLLLDKPLGLTSNSALQRIKRLYGAQKAGHTGSLDPLATGMLPICLGEATKFSQFLLEADKSYHVTGRLGIATITADSEGEVLYQRPVQVTKDDLHRALRRFRGAIDQIPPLYSALKHAGKPLYYYARRGINILRSPRLVTIHQLTLEQFTGEQFSLKVVCSKGTYIRSLISDLGEALGCGAHVIALRRLSVAHYSTELMVVCPQLTDYLLHLGIEQPNFIVLQQLLQPIESLVAQLPEVNLTTAELQRLQQGQRVTTTLTWPTAQVRLTHGPQGDFIGVGECKADAITVKRLMAFNSHYNSLRSSAKGNMDGCSG